MRGRGHSFPSVCYTSQRRMKGCGHCCDESAKRHVLGGDKVQVIKLLLLAVSNGKHSSRSQCGHWNRAGLSKRFQTFCWDVSHQGDTLTLILSGSSTGCSSTTVGNAKLDIINQHLFITQCTCMQLMHVVRTITQPATTASNPQPLKSMWLRCGRRSSACKTLHAHVFPILLFDNEKLCMPLMHESVLASCAPSRMSTMHSISSFSSALDGA